MYHPTRGGVREFSWDDVKVDKHRENYLGHSIKASVGRWQKGKDLHWYTRDKNSKGSDADALKEEIKRVKEEEEQLMREALGLAPKRSTRPQGNRLDKHEFSELVKRSSTADDLGEGHSEAARVDGLGFSRMPRPWEDPITLQSGTSEVSSAMLKPDITSSSTRNAGKDESKDESLQKKRRREEKREEKKRDKREKHEKRHSRDSDDKRKRRKDKEKRRHDSDSD
ncbi:Multiple myeloma tumor-associated 2 [Tripterygium wilfordii]|uniref:Multiple myeloma tumor-associated 2 n=1 Tax=Tripterygium wilfordii TaxID=458696 RepID=A0A7J7D835_TRIWF|nr:Multiple myeloma tumor-associated 2 [Tripterygium wilfordii]